jgi:hypothetical protein
LGWEEEGRGGSGGDGEEGGGGTGGTCGGMRWQECQGSMLGFKVVGGDDSEYRGGRGGEGPVAGGDMVRQGGTSAAGGVEAVELLGRDEVRVTRL